MRQDQKKKNPKQNEIIFWRAGPLEYRLPPVSEYCRNPSMSVYQLALLWEAEFGFIDVFFWSSFNAFAHFMMSDLQMYLPTLCSLFSRYWPKMSWPLYPTLPIHSISPWVTPPPPIPTITIQPEVGSRNYDPKHKTPQADTRHILGAQFLTS